MNPAYKVALQFLDSDTIILATYYIQGGKKLDLFDVDNFEMVSGRKVCDVKSSQILSREGRNVHVIY